MSVVDLFAGPGGWDLAALALGLDPLGIEWEPDACSTRAAAELRTFKADVAALTPRDFAPVTGLIASPPCQAYSAAGKGAGRRDRAIVEGAAAKLAQGDDGRASARRACEDARSLLVVEPLRWALDLEPEWIACEQVPGVLPLWRLFAHLLERRGYHTWAGKLNAANYGVPQTRERAFLLASRTRRVGPPLPTHHDARKGQCAEGLAPWITMAEALGWGLNEEPAGTLVSVNEKGGPRTGALDGGSGSRARYRRAQEEGRWKSRLNTGRDWQEGGDRDDAQTIDPEAQPAPSVTGKSGGQWRLVNGNQENRTVRSPDEPASTIAFGHNSARVRWEEDRPATTVAGDPRIHPPGHKENADDPPGKYHQRRGVEAIRVAPWEAAVLQGFAAHYPWCGNLTSVFQQIGNAVPPPLAYHVLRAVVPEA